MAGQESLAAFQSVTRAPGPWPARARWGRTPAARPTCPRLSRPTKSTSGNPTSSLWVSPRAQISYFP